MQPGGHIPELEHTIVLVKVLTPRPQQPLARHSRCNRSSWRIWNYRPSCSPLYVHRRVSHRRAKKHRSKAHTKAASAQLTCTVPVWREGPEFSPVRAHASYLCVRSNTPVGRDNERGSARTKETATARVIPGARAVLYFALVSREAKKKSEPVTQWRTHACTRTPAHARPTPRANPHTSSTEAGLDITGEREKRFVDHTLIFGRSLVEGHVQGLSHGATVLRRHLLHVLPMLYFRSSPCSTACVPFDLQHRIIP